MSDCPYCYFPYMCQHVTDKLANLKSNSTHFFYFFYKCQRLYLYNDFKYYHKDEIDIITKYIKKISYLFHHITDENELSILNQMQTIRDVIQSELVSIQSKIIVRELLYNDNKDYVCVFGGGNWTKDELDNYF